MQEAEYQALWWVYVVMTIPGFFFSPLLHNWIKSSKLVHYKPYFVVGILYLTSLAVQLFYMSKHETVFADNTFVPLEKKDLYPKYSYSLFTVTFAWTFMLMHYNRQQSDLKAK